MIDADFKAVLDRVGLATKEKIIPDGRLHRFTVKGDRPGSKNGWYVLYSGNLPAGAYGSWKTGDSGTWCAKADRDLSPAEREENRRFFAKTQSQQGRGCLHRPGRFLLVQYARRTHPVFYAPITYGNTKGDLKLCRQQAFDLIDQILEVEGFGEDLRIGLDIFLMGEGDGGETGDKHDF